MSRRVAALAAVVLLTLVGCSREDDELTPPEPKATTTVTAPTPSATAAAVHVPKRITVGDAGLDPADPVWAQGSTINVGGEARDLSPRRVDALAPVRGGVYFLDGAELWFTDLMTVKGTGLTGATGLRAAADGTAIRVSTPDGSYGFDTTTGRRVAAHEVHPATALERLGTPGRIQLRTERSDVSPGKVPLPTRMGTDRFGLVDLEGGPLVAFDTTYDLRVPLRGVIGTGFDLVRWTGPASFYGLALDSDRPRAVLGCDLHTQICRRWGDVDPEQSLLFESGS